MSSFFLIAGVLAITSSGASFEIPCPTEGCSNITIYLGPKWGSKLIILPNYPKVSGPREEEARGMMSNSTSKVVVHLHSEPRTTVTRAEHNQGTIDPSRFRIGPTRRTTTTSTASPRAGYSWPWWRPSTTTRTNAPSWRFKSYSHEWTRDDFGPHEVVDFTGKSLLDYPYNGDNVKIDLSNLTEETRLQVKHLYLSHNNIDFLPQLTFPVELEYGLTELRLDHNPMNGLYLSTAFELSRLISLKVLNISFNNISSLDALFMPSLTILDLSYNNLNYLPSNLEGLPNLRELYLNNNRITYLSSFPANVRYLQVLSLANNQIMKFEDYPFQSLPVLQTVYLTNNSLVSLSNLDLHHAHLYLSGNPLQCSCPLLDWVQDESNNIAERYKLMCTDPEHPYPLEVTFLTRDDVYINCPSRGRNRLENVSQWFYSHGVYRSTAYHMLAWLLLVGAVVVVVWVLQRRKKVVPLEVPYNVLDDKMLTA